MDLTFDGWSAWTRAAGLTAGVVLAVLLLHTLIYRAIAALGRRRPRLRFLDGKLLDASCAPLRLVLPTLAVTALLPTLLRGLPPAVHAGARDLLYVLMVVAVAWLLIRMTDVMRAAVARRFDVGVADNLTARKVRTQIEILRRILIVAIFVLSLASILMHFESFRELGTGLLASAGVAGVVIGFAAQRTLGNLLAGFQLAVTQPIRVDDVVIVEGEWGTVEEITLTYVVVRIWDQRRLVLPISYFLEKPFQNWTRTSSELLGTAFFYVDHTVPVQAVREELHRILLASEHWDGAVWRLHVTDVKERTVELRALMSASNASRAFELRCEVREKLVDFLRREHPQALPVFRTRLSEEDAAALGGDGADRSGRTAP